MKIITIIILTIVSQSIMASEFNLNTDSRFIPDFSNRFSILLGVNPDMIHTNENENFHFSYAAHRIENAWWDFNLTYSKGYFNKLTTNNIGATQLSDAQMSNSTTSTQLAIGAGFQYETRYIQTLVPFDGMYELMGASATYDTFKDPQVAQSFSGFGIIAKYSVLKKLSNFVSIGGNFIYNLAVVKRSQNNSSETSSTRSLTLSHVTLGIDFSFYL